MKRTLILTAVAVALMLGTGIVTTNLPATAQSVESTAALVETTFYVENMTCALCPVTVKAAMSAVKGVSDVEIDFLARTARVIYDPSLVSIDEIGSASAAAGYPAQPKG